jgi:hypothetical protein
MTAAALLHVGLVLTGAMLSQCSAQTFLGPHVLRRRHSGG